MAKSSAMKKETGRSVAKVEPKKQEVATEQDTNYFTEYGKAAAAGSNIVGSLLKFSKGDFVAGQDADVVDEGTRLIANMDQLLVGWQRWEDQRPAEQIMGALSEGFQPPPRSTLSFTDQSEWEVDAEGKPRDPWVFTHLLLMKEPGKNGQLYTFTTNSSGGKTAMGKLAGEYGKEMREHPDEYPVVELQVGAYKHQNPEYGRIKFPIFAIVDWADKSEFDDAAEAPATGTARKKIR